MKQEKKKNPELRFPEFTKDWKDKHLHELATRVTKKNTDNIINLVLTNSAKKGIVSQQDYFDKDIANQNNLAGYYVVEKNNFVYNPRISFSAPVGPIKRNKLKIGVMSPLYSVFKFDNENLDFFEQYFDSSHWHKYLKSVANYGARYDRMNITISDFYEMPIMIPGVEEKNKITDFLSKVDEKIEYIVREQFLLEKFKKGITKKIFDQEIFFKDENGERYPNWESKQLQEVLKERKTRNNNSEYDEVFSVAKNKGVINQIKHLGRSYSSSDISNYKVVFPNDIVYTKSPTSDFPYGIIKQNKTDRIGVVSVLYAVFEAKNTNTASLLDYYFSVWQRTFNYLNPLVHKGPKNTMNINNNDFLEGKNIRLPTSPEEQNKIISFLSKIDKKIDLLEKEYKKIKTFKKALLQRMLI